MNPLNYGSIEASRRLVDSGIVLETEVSWWTYPRESDGTDWQWEIVLSPKHYTDKRDVRYIPAPSMAEVWRELPVGTTIIKGVNFNTCLNDFNGKHIYDANPTDALIDLLIWVTEQKGKEKI